jgi:ComF family protein
MGVRITSLLEKSIAFLAPHYCLGCSEIDNVLCPACVFTLERLQPPFCVFCGYAAADWRICVKCCRKAPLDCVWVGADYEGLAAAIIKNYKFNRVREAYVPLAELLNQTVPYLEPDWLVVPIATVPSHVRQRGYDHAWLIAEQLAELRGLRPIQALRRWQNGHQLGLGRKQRTEQMEQAFYVVEPDKIQGKKILLVDDVCTTGATLASAARALRHAGAEQICGAVVAYKS